jgi:membrane protein required for colicin V production
MHWLDIVILVILGIGAALGFWTGLLWQVARVVSLAVSLYLAIMLNGSVAGWIGEHWKDASVAFNRIAAFVIVFILVYAILYLLTLCIHEAIKATRLETMDRILGAVLGAVKMTAVVAGVCAALSALSVPIFQEWLDEATIAPGLAKGTQALVSCIPQSYRDQVNDGVVQVREQLQDKVADAAKDAIK